MEGGRGGRGRGRGGGRGYSPTATATARWVPRAPQSQSQSQSPPVVDHPAPAPAPAVSVTVTPTSPPHQSPSLPPPHANHSQQQPPQHTPNPAPSPSPHVFDICPPDQSKTVVLKPALHLKNRQLRKQRQQQLNNNNLPDGSILRPGMVHLKSYLSLPDQVNIVNTCRHLGLGVGGFYQPAFRDGAHMNLHMMCLGKIWDPDRSCYAETRVADGAKAPPFPPDFLHLVHNAIRDSHALIKHHHNTDAPQKLLPPLSPDIVVVNFYTRSGRLGLHQDKHESDESLRKGLPVVSFSIGEAADFLYGDDGDVDKAQKVVLESGDVLIFGGKSRTVFHGVSTIHGGTAPELLLQETKLRPGRLNLTFRQY